MPIPATTGSPLPRGARINRAVPSVQPSAPSWRRNRFVSQGGARPPLAAHGVEIAPYGPEFAQHHLVTSAAEANLRLLTHLVPWMRQALLNIQQHLVHRLRSALLKLEPRVLRAARSSSLSHNIASRTTSVAGIVPRNWTRGS